MKDNNKVLNDFKNKKEYRNIIIEKYMYLIDDYVSKYDINVEDDIRGLGYCKLVELIDYYVKNDLSEDIVSYISFNLNKYFRYLNKINYCVKYDEKLENDYYQKDMDDNVLLDNMLSLLGERTSNIIKLYSYRYTFDEIAKMLNISKSRVEAIYKAAIKSLKNNYIVHDDKISNLDDVSMGEIYKSNLSNDEKAILIALKMGMGKRIIANSFKMMPKDINVIEKKALIKLKK